MPYSSVCLVAPRRRPRGVTLLEVLISVGVLLLGLVGVAVLLPAGQHNAIEALKVDRGSAVGRAALRQVRVLDMLNANNWYKGGTSGSVVGGTATNDGNALVIDPLLASWALENSNSYSSSVSPFLFPYTQGANVSVNRYTLAGTAQAAMRYGAAARIFQGADDIYFQPAGDASRPSLNWLWTDGIRAATNSNTKSYRVTGLTVGDYSWLATVSPDFTDRSGTWNAATQYIVSTVVFYKRDLTFATATDDKASERVVRQGATNANYPSLQILLFGHDGGLVQFSVSSGAVGAGYSPNSVAVRPGEWLALMANYRASGATLKVCKWYRVVSTTAFDPTIGQIVTLAGPDWSDWSNTTSYSQWQAVLMTGVVGVYSRSVEFRQTPEWSQ